MQILTRRSVGLIIAASLSWFAENEALGQSPSLVKERIHQSQTMRTYGAARVAELTQFYITRQYSPAWIGTENILLLESYLRLLSCADYEGLQPDDYKQKAISDFASHTVRSVTLEDSLDMELMITSSAIDYFRDLVSGNGEPPLAYRGFSTVAAPQNSITDLSLHVMNRSLLSYAYSLQPTFPDLQILCSKLSSFLDRAQSISWWDPVLNNKDVTAANVPLMTKLYLLGLTDKIDEVLQDCVVVKKLKSAQSMLNITADGKLSKQSLQELNVPIRSRIEQLNRSINYTRWLANLCKRQAVMVVNIPAARLAVYKGDSTLLGMRMIVGKPSTPTPTLLSVVDKVILYPYWHVPYSIATKELLPIFKRDPGYVTAGNYQVLNTRGKIINPRSINWSVYSRNNFPFTIRQSTGCDNALGLLKLDFESPFGVYLHDTPVKALFGFDKRFMSHGCMRMEKPMELGRMVLAGNEIAIDTLSDKGCLKNQFPITVPAAVKMPVVVWYNPAGIGRNQSVVFYQDVYNKLQGIKK